jgi:hypothetical protein
VSGQQHAPTVLYPRERPGTHCTGGWVGPRAGLDWRKISPHRNSNPDRPARSPAPIPTELPGPPIRDEVDYITKIRVAMSTKRSAVKTSECDSVVKMSCIMYHDGKEEGVFVE